ncbi:MAG: ATP-binding cassette domain-containing protein [Saprospiraceae bacterium]|jgi:cell division transport system ATP-binding protein|nr:ATP-binding cassette domain-containing protein [Saprospiraceae bacterium]
MSAVLECHHLNLAQNKKPILQDVNFSLNAGELVYLIGKTGSGKSTLLKAIYGEIKPTSGSLIVAGTDMLKLKKSKLYLLKRRIGIVFQDHNLLMDRNVYDNLFFVLKSTGWKNRAKMEERISEVLTKVGLSSKLSDMPYELSGGEQQRLGIARAMLNEPVLIIADEPTGNLDPETSSNVFELLTNLAKEKGTAIILATHDFKMIENHPSKILVCRDGSIKDA